MDPSYTSTNLGGMEMNWGQNRMSNVYNKKARSGELRALPNQLLT